MLHCQLCSTRYTALQIKNCSKALLQSTHIERNGAVHPSYINYHLKSEVSTTLHVGYAQPVTIRIKNCSKSTSAIKVATMKNMDNFRFEGKPSRATIKSTLFAVSKDERDTKEDNGKSIKNSLYVLQYAKRHLSG